MITLKEWFELAEYRVTEGWQYQWNCFGFDCQGLDSSNDQFSFSILFDRKDQTVYQVEAFDYVHDRAYRMINPAYQNAYKLEAENKGVNPNQAWDSVDFVDLDVDDDFIQKCLSIKAGEDYDTRVQVQVDFSDEELLQYMTMAHERDITFNQLVEEALKHAIEEFERDPEGMKARAEAWKDK